MTQRMQDYIDTADSGLSLFDSGCKRHSFREFYQIVDA